MVYDAECELFSQLAPSPEIRAPRFPKNMYAESYPEIFLFCLAVVDDGNAKMVQGRAPRNNTIATSISLPKTNLNSQDT
jgi:hypothetical protein